MVKPLLIHVARYLAPALLDYLENSDEIVAGTVKPDEEIWRPHFIGTTAPKLSVSFRAFGESSPPPSFLA